MPKVDFREEVANVALAELLARNNIRLARLLGDNRQDCPRIRFADYQGLLCEGLFVSQRCYRIDAHG